jgi:hypothetical protein
MCTMAKFCSRYELAAESLVEAPRVSRMGLDQSIQTRSFIAKRILGQQDRVRNLQIKNVQ